jgi:hypothetical protein
MTNRIILFILSIFQFLSSSKNVLAVERIWFIRHCDKQNDNNPCCSDEGYLRSKTWNSYFEKYIPLENKVKIVTSDFSGDFVCVHHDNFTLSSSRSEDIKKCQQSQRMYLSAHYLYESMKLKYSLDGINYKFCIRSGIEMIKSVLEMYDNKYDDIIVIWEHTEIIEMIRFFDIYIKKWSIHAIDRHDIIFMVSLKDSKLYVDYNIEYDNKSLGVNVTDSIYSNWLHFDRIQDYDDFNPKSRFYEKIIWFLLITIGLSLACCVHCDEYIFYYYYNRNNRTKQQLHNKKREKYYFNPDII